MVFVLTAAQLHLTIQGIGNQLPANDNAIPINLIAEQLHIGSEDLTINLNILRDMSFLKFADRKNESVRLTFTGKYASPPHEL